MGSSARVLARWGHHPGTSAGDITQTRLGAIATPGKFFLLYPSSLLIPCGM